MEYPHTAEAMFVSIMSVLHEYSIQNNILNIIFDNAINNTATIELFNRQLKTLTCYNLFHVRCVYYIINLIFKYELKIFKEKIKKLKTCHHVY